MSPDDRAAAIDLATALGIAALACAFGQHLAVMSALVPAALALRMLAWWRLPRSARPLSMGREALFVLACALVGGANDWNTVVRRGVYAYTVPTDLPGLSSIPVWMLLFWGMILRLVVTLARWPRLGADSLADDAVHLPGRALHSAGLRAAVLLALVLGTRLCVYRYYRDPVASWAPFALAAVVYGLVLRPARGAKRLALVFLAGGVVVEAAMIRVGHVHWYRLGWLLGVPIWIALWWALAVLVWGELGGRALRALGAPRLTAA